MRKNRAFHIDICRIIATWGVICIHTCGDELYQYEERSAVWWQDYFWGGIFFWCVPFFLMISGMLSIDKEINYKKTLIKVGKLISAKCITILAFAAFYLVYFWHYQLEWAGYLHQVFIEDGGTYFLLVLAGCYLSSPIFHEICKKQSLEKYFILLCLFFCIVVPIMEELPVASKIAGIWNASAYFYLPLGLNLYFVLGHYLGKYIVPTISMKKAALFLGVSLVLHQSIRIFNVFVPGTLLVKILFATNQSYDATLTLIPATAIFIFLLKITERMALSEKAKSFITHIGRNTIAIYVLHYPLIRCMQFLGIRPSSFGIASLGVFIEVSGIFTLGYLISLIWERIPVLKRIIV